jgi:hypothetical protein
MRQLKKKIVFTFLLDLSKKLVCFTFNLAAFLNKNVYNHVDFLKSSRHSITPISFLSAYGNAFHYADYITQDRIYRPSRASQQWMSADFTRAETSMNYGNRIAC